MQYDFYHDESLVAGYWHGMFLVPADTCESLLALLNKVRQNLRYEEPVKFGGVDRSGGRKFRCVQSWLTIAACTLTQKMKGEPSGYMTGKITHVANGKRDFEYEVMRAKIGAKFILFRVKDGHSSLGSNLDYGAKVETTLRMGLKGGLHLLGDLQSPIHVRSFHFDGHEHFGRHIDLSRIVDRITNLREYCSFARPLTLDDRTSDHRKSESQNYEDCQLLQLTDLIVGAFRTVLGRCTNEVQLKVSYPVKQLVDRWNEGPARMRNSRWFEGFCISQCYVHNGEWQFQNIPSTEGSLVYPTLFESQHF